MTTYYVFQGTDFAMIVTDDKTGAKLPKHPTGAWVYSREVNFNRGDKGTIGASADAIIAAIERDGYFQWPLVMTFGHSSFGAG
jgi:hypothetical protein